MTVMMGCVGLISLLSFPILARGNDGFGDNGGICTIIQITESDGGICCGISLDLDLV